MLASTLIRALTAAPLRRPGKSWPSCRPPRVGRILPRPPHPVKRRAEEARGWGHAVSSDLAGVGDRLGDGHWSAYRAL